MNKQEKYYSYIVSDLVKKTEIDNDNGHIKFPFRRGTWSILSEVVPVLSYPSRTKRQFDKHISLIYGTKEDESDM